MFYFSLYSQYLQCYSLLSKLSTNICFINEWINEWISHNKTKPYTVSQWSLKPKQKTDIESCQRAIPASSVKVKPSWKSVLEAVLRSCCSWIQPILDSLLAVFIYLFILNTIFVVYFKRYLANQTTYWLTLANFGSGLT